MFVEHCISKDKAIQLQQYLTALPPLHVLIAGYGVHPAMAWALWRPVVTALEPELMVEVSKQAVSPHHFCLLCISCNRMAVSHMMACNAVVTAGLA